MRIFEVFDSPYSAELGRAEYGGDYEVEVKLPDGSYLHITFEKIEDEVASYYVEFSKNRSYDVTNEGDAYKIFSTVLKVIIEFVKKVRPYEITFGADKETGHRSGTKTPTGRVKLYDRMVKKYADKLGYKLKKDEDSSSVYYYLYLVRRSR
jgi:hypothetical protein